MTKNKILILMLLLSYITNSLTFATIDAEVNQAPLRQRTETVVVDIEIIEKEINEFLDSMYLNYYSFANGIIDTAQEIKENSEEKARKEKDFQENLENIYAKVKNKYNLDYEYVGLYVKQLNTGHTWMVNNDLVYDPTTGKTKGKFSVASAVKLPMAFSILKYLEENDMPINTQFTDSLSGKTLEIGEITRRMVSESINKNFNYLLRYMGQNGANEYLEKNGIMNSTINAELGGADPYWTSSRVKREYGTLNNSRITPEDYGLILEKVYEGVKNGNEYMVFLNQALLDNIFSSRIPRGIEYRYPVAHKTGTYSAKGKFADVGIVYMPNNPYIIVLNLDNQWGKSHEEVFMREFSHEVNEYMESN